jgi:hypothetical protein
MIAATIGRSVSSDVYCSSWMPLEKDGLLYGTPKKKKERRKERKEKKK